MGNPFTHSDPEDTPVSNGSVFSRGGICRGLSEVQRWCFVGCSTFLGSIDFRGRAIFLPPISPRRLQTSCLRHSDVNCLMIRCVHDSPPWTQSKGPQRPSSCYFAGKLLCNLHGHA